MKVEGLEEGYSSSRVFVVQVRVWAALAVLEVLVLVPVPAAVGVGEGEEAAAVSRTAISAALVAVRTAVVAAPALQHYY